MIDINTLEIIDFPVITDRGVYNNQGWRKGNATNAVAYNLEDYVLIKEFMFNIILLY